MERLTDKICDGIEFFQSLDYRRLAQNLGGIFSFAIVHFVSYIYFAVETIPLFVDTVSFASITFSVAAYFAVASVFGRVFSIMFVRALLPIFMDVFLRVKARKHRRLRNRRLKESYRERIVVSPHWLAFVLKICTDVEAIYISIIRYVSITSFFLLMYVGALNAIASLFLLAIFVLILFLYYFSINFIFNTFRSSGIRKVTKSGYFKNLAYEVKSIPTYCKKLVIAANKEFKRVQIRDFFFTHFVIIGIVTSMIIGTARSAHVLDTSIYAVIYLEGAQERSIQSLSIFSKSANGILGLNNDEEEFVFISYDSGLIIRNSHLAGGDRYGQKFWGDLFPFFIKN